MSYRGKRLLDLALGIPAIVLSLPVQAVVAALIRWRMGSPILFRQTRPGLHGVPFDLVKFRSMLSINEAAGLVDDASRMTPLGSALRSTSLDELPTLWNVVRGQMSLVGPRPLRMEYLPRYTPTQATRHDVRPGITGLAQVSGRNALTWEEKLRLDVEYVKRQSFGLDLLLIARTCIIVFRRKGISAPGFATMPEFTGAKGENEL